MGENIIKFDHYSNRFSYLRFIMETLDRGNIEEAIVGQIFNTFLSRLDSNEIAEIVIYSSLFESKVNSLEKDRKQELLNNLYDCYIKGMIINYSNGDVEAVIYFFKTLMEKVKMYSGYYGIYGEEGCFKSIEKRENNYIKVR